MENQTLIDILKYNLQGKLIRHKNKYNRDVSLKVEDVKIKNNSRQITADTRENDWWGESCNWDTVEMCFIDGSTKEYSLSEKIIIEP